MLHAEAQRRRRRARPLCAIRPARPRRERGLLVGLGLLFGLLTLVWFDAATAPPPAAPLAPPQTAGNAR